MGITKRLVGDPQPDRKKRMMELHLIKRLNSLRTLVLWATISENCPEEAQAALSFLSTLQVDLESIAPQQFEKKTASCWPKAHIYALVDPRDGTIHYIGQTSEPEERFRAHYSSLYASPIARWMNELRSLGLRPIPVILETTSSASTREQYWIRLCLMMGEPIENTLK
jgi:hypothetical protein